MVGFFHCHVNFWEEYGLDPFCPRCSFCIRLCWWCPWPWAPWATGGAEKKSPEDCLVVWLWKKGRWFAKRRKMCFAGKRWVSKNIYHICMSSLNTCQTTNRWCCQYHLVKSRYDKIILVYPIEKLLALSDFFCQVKNQPHDIHLQTLKFLGAPIGHASFRTDTSRKLL